MITLRERQVVERSNRIHSMFAPLRIELSRVPVGFAKDSPDGRKALVASEFSPQSVGHRHADFRTFVPGVRCKYFELWALENKDVYKLHQAYFSVMRADPTSREYVEILGVHADPHDDELVKRMPHLHVSCAPHPIGRCHFVLESGFVDHVLKDCESLTAAMTRAIHCIGTDLLTRFPKDLI